jgi:uncharacterized SAM-binding protein YcdF (DUF218 family)
MFFVLSKILYFLLVPFWWIIILLIWLWLSKSKKTKKRLQVLIVLILVVFTNPFFYRSMVMLWQPASVSLLATTKYDAGIVLGGMSGSDKNGHGHFGNNADRFIQMANLYHRGIVKKIIVSGGTGSLRQDEPPESVFLRTQFLDNGVQDSDIIIESRSRNTYENAVYSKKITDSLHLQPPFVLVTSALHMKRSVNVFQKAGFSCVPFPGDYKVTTQKFSLDDTIIPDPTLLKYWGDFLKEMIGLYVYKLTGKA